MQTLIKDRELEHSRMEEALELLHCSACRSRIDGRAMKVFKQEKRTLRWNLKNLSRGLNPPKPGLNLAPA